jgi:hypothetical protein
LSDNADHFLKVGVFVALAMASSFAMPNSVEGGSVMIHDVKDVVREQWMICVGVVKKFS